MSESEKKIQTLDENETATLNRRGWHLVDLYRSREGGEGSTAYNKAMEKALKVKREVGIRTVVKDGVTYFEVWEHW